MLRALAARKLKSQVGLKQDIRCILREGPLRYGGTNGAKQALGEIPKIKQAFTEIQSFLYAE